MSRWDSEAFEYYEVDRIKKALIGRSIVRTEGAGGDYPAVVRFILDDGSALIANATDGGCACSNGCFDIYPENAVSGTILNVEVREEVLTWERGSDGELITKQIGPGSMSDGSSTIRVFVYTELGEASLLRSEGSDNGYYGWGFWLKVESAS